MQRPPDNRMPSGRWWLLALATALTFGVFCLVTRSWTPLRAGWPIIAVIVALAVIRQGAGLYEQHNEHDHDHRAGRRHAPHV